MVGSICLDRLRKEGLPPYDVYPRMFRLKAYCTIISPSLLSSFPFAAAAAANGVIIIALKWEQEAASRRTETAPSE